MLERLKEEVTTLNETKEFKEYKKNSPNSFLCAGFLMIEHLERVPWQIDFFDPDGKVMTTFKVAENLEMNETKEFTSSEEGVTELNLEKVDYDFEDALKVIDGLLNDKYQGHKANKIITVLQNIEGNETWNITYLTNQFHILNVRINAETGELIREKMQPVMNFKASE